MTFDEIYPDAQDDFISGSFEGFPPVVKLPECQDPACESDHACIVCGKPTRWANGTAVARVCSTECNTKIWAQLISSLVAEQIARGP